MTEIKNTKRQIALPIIISLSVVVGMIIGISLGSFNTPIREVQYVANKYTKILNLIKQDYVDTVNTDKLVEHSIVKMLEKLDPHTSYIPAKDQKLVQSQLEGSFEGIGVEFNIIRDTLYIINPIENGPSHRAGLLAGDKIIKVNDTLIAGINISNKTIFNKLRGPKNSKVKLSIQRKNHVTLLEFVVTRDDIQTPTIDSFLMMDYETGYIKITRFGSLTDEEFKRALKSLRSQGMEQLIIDLRENGGGYLSAAINILDELLPKDRLLLKTIAKNKKYNETHVCKRSGSFEMKPVIVLINEYSASASEIVSGALQDNDRALIVGRRSYGKGLVQVPLKLKDGSELRLTISRYYTPSGRCIQKAYTKGKLDAYSLDLAERNQRGELYSADSIKQNDSLKYVTRSGRIVYGGGGITPDLFIPKDTSIYTNYLSDLYKYDIIRLYVLDYVFENKKDLLTYDNYQSFNDSFEVSEKMLKNMINLGIRNQVPFNEKEFNGSKNFIKLQTKAFIARQLWKNNGYYYVMLQKDEFLHDYQKMFIQANSIMKQGYKN